MKRLMFVLACLVALPAQSACRQALALGLDVSGSVDPVEYRLQLDGLAGALQTPVVIDAILILPDTPVEIAVFEWSGPDFQRLLVPWTGLDSQSAIDQVSAALTGTDRIQQQRLRVTGGTTAIGQAMTYGMALLMTRDCGALTLDLSGDGKSNTGPRPRDVSVPPRITINGLTIETDLLSGNTRRGLQSSGLSSYYRAEVISGPAAFVETAIGFEAFQNAMVRKLLRELSGFALSHHR